MTRSTVLVRALAGAAALGVLLSACSGSDDAKRSSAAPSPSTPTSVSSSQPAPSTSRAASSTAARPAPTNPLTGVGGVPANPVIAVKIDDTAPGRPQVSIDYADVVYIEAVEGGLTRLAAVFATTMPKKVGYVRSTRPSDPDLLLQYGKITEAYSGGAHDSLPLVRASGITSWSNDAGAPFYFRSPHSGDEGYINLALNLASVAKKTRTPRPRSIGWTFNSALTVPNATGTDLRTRVTGSYSHSSGTPVEFRWDGSLRKYVRYIDGRRQVAANGRPVAATNVIVQECRVVSHPQDTDVNGNPSQFTYTVGSGSVYVFRQGRVVRGTWSRPSTSSGTVLRAANGATLPLAPGNTWVVLVRNGQPVATT